MKVLSFKDNLINYYNDPKNNHDNLLNTFEKLLFSIHEGMSDYNKGILINDIDDIVNICQIQNQDPLIEELGTDLIASLIYFIDTNTARHLLEKGMLTFIER